MAALPSSNSSAPTAAAAMSAANTATTTATMLADASTPGTSSTSASPTSTSVSTAHSLLGTNGNTINTHDAAEVAGNLPAPSLTLNQFNQLDEADIRTATQLALLRDGIYIGRDKLYASFGVVVEKNGGSRTTGIGTEVFASQRALQDRCKEFAAARCFQLYVAGSSTRPNGGGNVKYRCKKVHGQQYVDTSTPSDTLTCPFYINGFGIGEDAWKVTRACFVHNHYKFVGSATRPPKYKLTTSVEDAVRSQSMPPQRNTTLSTKALIQMVLDDIYKLPNPSLTLSTVDGPLIRRLLLARGHAINLMMSSRIKRTLHAARIAAVRTAFQSLASYFVGVAARNPGSLAQVETSVHTNSFTRAVFVSSAALHAFKHCRPLVALDHVLPIGCDAAAPNAGDLVDPQNDDGVCGVYLKALCVDANDAVVPFALALVVEETQANWEWFLTSIQTAAAAIDMRAFTVVAGCAHGVEAALARVWPNTPHRFCMRRIVHDTLLIRRQLTLTDGTIERLYALARCESENEFTTQRAAILHDAVDDAALAIEALDALRRPHWVKYAFLETFRQPTFDEITCDLAGNAAPLPFVESSAAALETTKRTMPASHTSWFGTDPMRSSQPLVTFSRYFTRLADVFADRRTAFESRTKAATSLVPARLVQLEQNLQSSVHCESIPCANGAFMVRSRGTARSQIFDTWRHVNLVDHECTCQAWQDMRFPCVHAIHAAELERRRIDTLYDATQYSIAHYHATYAPSFVVWPLDGATPLLEADANVQSPLDVFAVDDPVGARGRRKPGPKPKAKRPKLC